MNALETSIATEPDAEQLTRRSDRGQSIGEEELVKFLARFEGTAFRYAFKLTRCREDAEDICQQSKIRAFSAIQSTDIHSNPEAWFLRIIRNCVFDLMRFRRRRVDALSLDSFQMDYPSRELTDPHASNDFLQVEGRLSSTVQETMLRLSEEQRTMIFAHADGEFGAYIRSHPELSKGQCRTQLMKAQRTARRHLGKYVYSEKSA